MTAMAGVAGAAETAGVEGAGVQVGVAGAGACQKTGSSSGRSRRPGSSRGTVSRWKMTTVGRGMIMTMNTMEASSEYTVSQLGRRLQPALPFGVVALFTWQRHSSQHA